MRVYSRTYRCSDAFPVEKDEEWNVTQGGKLAERWRVLSHGRTTFTVEITEYFPANG